LFVKVSNVQHMNPDLRFIAMEESADLADRRRIACQALKELKLTFPCVLDKADKAVETAYDAFPMRLLIVDADGRIALDARRGIPDGWDFASVEAWLNAHPGKPVASGSEAHGARGAK
jgi:hypothetical protein